MTVHILGNGGHGRDIADIVKANAVGKSFRIFVEMCDDNPERGSPVPLGVDYLIGVADPKVRARLDRPDNKPVSWRHPSITWPVPPWSRDEDAVGVVIGAGTTIGPEVRQIGRASCRERV